MDTTQNNHNPSERKSKMIAMQIPDSVMAKLVPHLNQIRVGTFYKPTFRAKDNVFAEMKCQSDFVRDGECWSVEVNQEMQVVICNLLMSEVNNNNQGEK